MHTKKEKDLDETKSAASSTLSQYGSTAKKKLLEMIAPVCCIHGDNLRNLVEAYELNAGEDINGKTDFVVVDTSCNVRSDQNADILDYDIFPLEDMRAMAQMLEDVEKLGAHGHVF